MLGEKIPTLVLEGNPTFVRLVQVCGILPILIIHPLLCKVPGLIPGFFPFLIELLEGVNIKTNKNI
jgi:hypothetical protein